MFPTSIDVSASTREAVNHILQAALSDTLDLALQAKQAHWNLKGANFLSVHELFDAIASELHGYVDDIAERIAAFGGTPIGTVQGVATSTRLPRYPTTIVDWTDHVASFSEALSSLGKTIREAIDATAELGDAGTADLFTGMSRGLDKRLWFLESHLINAK